jgi:hypothetical protein
MFENLLINELMLQYQNLVNKYQRIRLCSLKDRMRNEHFFTTKSDQVIKIANVIEENILMENFILTKELIYLRRFQ